MDNSDKPALHVLDFIRDGTQRDPTCLGALFASSYDQVKEIARRSIRKLNSGETLRATALAHEAFLKLSASNLSGFQDKNHFLACVAIAMRQILVDDFRRRTSQKLNADLVAFSESAGIGSVVEYELLALDEALKLLVAIDPFRSRVVELRFFGGFSMTEIADLLGVSKKTVDRAWQSAKSWLHATLGRS